MQVYARNLLEGLASHAVAEIVVEVRAGALDQLPARCRALVRSGDKAMRYLNGARGVPGADLVHGLDVHVPLASRVPTVATVHDLSVWDAPWSLGRARAAAERLALAHAARRADALVAVSAFTAERIRERFHRDAHVVRLAPAPSMSVAPEAAREAVRLRYRLPERFVLHVGTVEPRKDVDALGAACRRIGIALVLAGATRPPAKAPSGSIALGYVPDCDLPALYGAATVVGYPSRYEGFGLPPLEAMACGAPVVGYRIPPLVEVLGDAALLSEPGDEDALARSIRELVEDPARRREAVEAGLAKARGYSWDATTRATISLYGELGVSCRATEPGGTPGR